MHAHVRITIVSIRRLYSQLFNLSIRQYYVTLGQIECILGEKSISSHIYYEQKIRLLTRHNEVIDLTSLLVKRKSQSRLLFII